MPDTEEPIPVLTPKQVNDMLQEELDKVSAGTKVPEELRKAAAIPTPKERTPRVRGQVQRVQREDGPQPDVDEPSKVPEVQRPEGAEETRSGDSELAERLARLSEFADKLKGQVRIEDHLQIVREMASEMKYGTVAGNRTLLDDINVLLDHIDKRVVHYRTVSGN